jgi:hypothetical protein
MSIDYMYNFKILLMGTMGLMLLGSSCSYVEDKSDMMGNEVYEHVSESTQVKDPNESISVVDEMVDRELVNLHNSYIPGFNIVYNDDLYEVAWGQDSETKEARGVYLDVNSDDVWLFPKGGEVTDRLLTMKFTKTTDASHEAIEESIDGIEGSKDIMIDEVEVRRHDIVSGSTIFIVIAKTGYYQMTVHDPLLMDVASTLSF